MLNTSKILYSLDDVAIMPENESSIEHRAECDPYYNVNGKDFLPLFTAPMYSVVNEGNFELFMKNHIIPILPRNYALGTRMEYIGKGLWAALSLNEFETCFIKSPTSVSRYKKHVLIDMANGHMEKLIDFVHEAKSRHGDNLVIMVGNVANPETFYRLSCAGADYIRIGIGVGDSCLTSIYTGIHYPMASLIVDCKKKIQSEPNPAKIVADGGMRGYSDIIKSLALGADYVMCGSLFNAMLESAAVTKIHEYKMKSFEYLSVSFNEGQEVNDKDMLYTLLAEGAPLYKEFTGMSTKEAQEILGKYELRESEGRTIVNDVKYTMEEWIRKFTAYLVSAMSYTNSRTIADLKSNTVVNLISQSSINILKNKFE